METKEKTTRRLRPLLPLLPPVLLSLLFYLFRGRQALMDGWVIHVMTPAEQLLGRLSAPLPFSLAEALVTVFLTACALCLIRGTVLAVRLHAPHELGRRLVCLLCALLWVWTGYCWLWSAGYYSASFAEKSGLETRPYTVSTLAQVTLYRLEDLVVDRVALVLDLMCLLRVLFERGCFRELLDGFNQQRRLGDGKL